MAVFRTVHESYLEDLIHQAQHFHQPRQAQDPTESMNVEIPLLILILHANDPRVVVIFGSPWHRFAVLYGSSFVVV